MNFILYNPRSKKNKCLKVVKRLTKDYDKRNVLYKILIIIGLDVKELFDSLTDDDRVIIVGGDGTIHFLANDLKDYPIEHDVYLYRGGTGNDFLRSIDVKKKFVRINPYISNLPVVKLEEDRIFVNGCGLGLDGMVCYYVNKSKKKTSKSFFLCTLKAFFKFKPLKAIIYVDGKKYEFKKVYLSSIMNGKYEGGGMMMAPMASRTDGLLDICIIHNISKFMLLLMFPLIYKGKHGIKKKSVTFLRGKEIRVEFLKPTYLQIDGETKELVDMIEVKAT